VSGPEVLRFAANLYRVPLEEGYFLVDAGLPWEARRLLALLKTPPRLLFLTHHHLDHSGGARALWERFGLPVLAHPREWPYLTGGLPPRFINEDHELARRTVRKILDLGAEWVYPGHGGPLDRSRVEALALRLGV
jgi:glyoxylase-like metal-dependent hydrolase (beta-lactamase superfamily II)